MGHESTHKLNVFSFNCSGFNSCLNEILKELKINSQIAFICEHWLQPCELPATQRLLQQEGLLSFLKSSVDPEEVLLGRPHGGIGFICKKSKDLYFNFMDVNSDRICVMKVLEKNSRKILLNVIGVYLPYFSGTTDQVSLYAETLDKLQSAIDECADAPITVVGDMNASLPQQSTISRQWYRNRPFNQHSLLLYDFMLNNDLGIANFMFDQTINYTYDARNARSYIDHVLISSYCKNIVLSCSIVDDEDWSSDHYPIRTEFALHFESQSSNMENPSCVPAPRFPRINWEKANIKTVYTDRLNITLGSDNEIHKKIQNIDNKCTAQSVVNELYNHLTEAIHNVCKTINEQENTKRKEQRRKVPWWSTDCTAARDRTRFWRSLWLRCEKSKNCYVYEVYKYVKKTYRNVRKKTMSDFHKNNYNTLSKLFKCSNSKQFWNKVKALKSTPGSNNEDIQIDCLQKFFREKFSNNSTVNTMTICNAVKHVNEKYKLLCDNVYHPEFNADTIVKLISKLKSGRAPGHDGLTPEHLKNAVNTRVPEYLSCIFNVCVIYGVIPDSFKIGIILPLLKKPNLDNTVPNNYRPIILSSVVSKLLEYAMLNDVKSHEFHDMQYGFVQGRGTQMAIVNANDIIKYFNHRGTAVFGCSLDAEKAFDAIPHSILLYKCSSVLSDQWWRLMFVWYTNLKAMVRWNNELSDEFMLCKGTRQGGLTSPFLFNLMYQELIDGLSKEKGGMRVGKFSYNVFCYADDLLLTSSTVTGLQSLINFANNYVTEHGLSFNATKSNCITFGKCYLQPNPVWSVNNCNINNVDQLDYLGAILGNNTDDHVNSRISKCRRAFYSLQGAGMCNNGAIPDVISHLWQTALQPILTYAGECFSLKPSNISELDKIQSKLIKSSLGLSKYMRTSPLLSAMGVRKLNCLFQSQSLKLYNCIMSGKSRITRFYIDSLRSSDTNVCYSLPQRVRMTCLNHKLSFVKVTTDRSYCKSVCKKLKTILTDGITDSCKMLLRNYDENNKFLLKLLLKPF